MIWIIIIIVIIGLLISIFSKNENIRNAGSIIAGFFIFVISAVVYVLLIGIIASLFFK